MTHDHEKMIRHAMIIAKHLASGGHVILTHRKHFEGGGDAGGFDAAPTAVAPAAPSGPIGMDPVAMKGEPLDWAHLHLPSSFTQGFVPTREQNVATPPSIIGGNGTPRFSSNPSFDPSSYFMPQQAALAEGPRSFARGGYADGGETDPMLDPDVSAALGVAKETAPDRPFGPVVGPSDVQSNVGDQSIPMHEKIFRAITGGRSFGNDISNISKNLPDVHAYGEALQNATEGARALQQQGVENMRSGELGRMALGAGQVPLGYFNQAIAPVSAAFDVGSETAGKFDPRLKAEVDVIGALGTEGSSALAKASRLAQEHGAPLTGTLAMAGIPAKAGEAERAVQAAKDVAGGEVYGPPEMYGPKAPASIADTSHEMNVERGERKTINPRNIRLTPEERDIVNSFESPGHRAMVAGAIRNTRSRYPVSDGWAPMQLSDATINEKGLPELSWQQPAYGFNRQMQDVQKVVLDDTGQPVKAPKLDRQGNPVVDENGNPVLLKRNLTESAREERAMKRGTPEYDRSVERAAKNSYDEISNVVDRANNGDEAAKVMLRQVGWYREFMRKGFDERGGAYPAFSDLLGATSPNTAVDQNYAYAVDAQQRHARGDFDPKVEFAKNYQGSLTEFPPEQLIRRTVTDPKTGELKQYGMNSRNAQMAMADRWRDVEPGSAPKARNFSGNLGGATDAATIDVWAARHLQRMLGRDRLPPPIEGGVKGKMEVTPNNPDTLRAGGEFGFGQDVFQNLSDKINQSNLLKPYLDQLGYKEATPMDLQALAWFLEKEHWTKNNWTTAAGEGGSFEQEMAKNPAQRWQSGFSIQQEEPPTDALMAKTRGIVDGTLQKDPQVSVYRTNPTAGRYAGDNERAFDSELTAHPDWNPSQWMASIIQQAKEHNQKDLFFSKRLSPEEAETNPNARPGAEIYFQNRKEMQDILPILDQFTNRGQDGFTFVTDLRHRERVGGGAESPDFTGVRMQYVPEIRMRYNPKFREKVLKDPNFLAKDMQDAQDRMQDAINALDQQGHKIVDARIHHYDTLALGKESYDKFLNGITDPHNASSAYESKSGAVNPVARFGKPIQSHVAGRDHALREGIEGRSSNDGPAMAQPNTGVKPFAAGGSAQSYNKSADMGRGLIDRALFAAQKFGPAAAQDAVSTAKQLARGRP